MKNAEKAGLTVKRDMFDTFPAYFESKAKALEAQIAWAEQRAERLRATGKRAFVHVVTGQDSHFYSSDHKAYEYADEKDKSAGTIIYICTTTGATEEKKNYALKAKATTNTDKGSSTAATPAPRELPASAYEAAHVLRARALRHSLLGDTHRTLVLTVHALLVYHGASYGAAALQQTGAWNPTITTPEIEAKLTAAQQVLSGVLGSAPSLAFLPGEQHYGEKPNLKLFDYLVSLNQTQLLDLLNVLVAARIYEPHYHKDPPAQTFLRLAAEVQADKYLEQTFELTDEWLKRYPREELLKLADEAKLPRAPLEQCKTNKDMRAQILEHAQRLHAEGFVPALVRFPAAPKAKAAKASKTTSA